MYYSYEEIEKVKRLMPYLLKNEQNTRAKRIADISEEYIFYAKGINVNHILFMNKAEYCEYEKLYFPIENIYSEIFDNTTEFYYSKEDLDLIKFIRYINNTEIVKLSNSLSKEINNDYFNYCIYLSDKYIPNIKINIGEKIESILDLKKTLDLVYSNSLEDLKDPKLVDSLKERYDVSLRELKAEITKYICLWIHAYRYLKARQLMMLENPNIITFSHRYYGWSKPRQNVDQNLSIEFKTNFGYGNSSYFYLLLIYKGIQIFPFIEWVNYKYASVSNMEKYTEKYQRITKKTNKRTNKQYNVTEIYQSYWENAFNDLITACNISKKSEKFFVDTYIIKALDHLVEELEKVFELTDIEANNRYRDFNYNFTIRDLPNNYIKKIKLMHVKGSIITGALDLIGHISKLQVFIDTKIYISKIIDLNNRILPMLVETIPLHQKQLVDYDSVINSFYKELAYIWNDKGLKNYKFQKDISEEEREYFEELNEKHISISDKKNEAEQEQKHIKNLLKSIERYIINIDKYLLNKNS
ncbi:MULTISPECIES: hypothetical protein [Psychrobacter]|uniref:hypothetical protein n=1 Tax=Psychrobacter TaxID=497 RepID=UPI00146BD877|nr:MULTISPECIES: hypothetical protein [Psychrobacter]